MPYLRLNKTRKPLFLQLETTKALKKLTEEKFSEIFFEVSGKSHSCKKCKRDPLGLLYFAIHSVAKYQKIDGGTLWSNKKIRGKNGNLNSLRVPKKAKVS